MAYFERLSDTKFLPTRHTAGAWNTNEQHIAPAVGLLAHVVERDGAQRGTGFVIGRLSYDILGPIPIEAMEAQVQVVRPGKTIELTEGVLTHNSRAVLRLRAWSMLPRATQEIAGSPFPQIAAPEDMPAWDASAVWPGGFIASVELRRVQHEPGRAAFWVRSREALVDGEPVSDLARAASLFDIANGMTVRADPREVAFPNLDITIHLFETPRGPWTGFDTSVSFGSTGAGLTSTVLHDVNGPVGTIAQSLTVRPIPKA